MLMLMLMLMLILMLTGTHGLPLPSQADCCIDSKVWGFGRNSKPWTTTRTVKQRHSAQSKAVEQRSRREKQRSGKQEEDQSMRTSRCNSNATRDKHRTRFSCNMTIRPRGRCIQPIEPDLIIDHARKAWMLEMILAF
jgi:hypothetical protein